MANKKSKFNGNISGTPYVSPSGQVMVFGILEDGANVIVGNSLVEAKALIGSVIEYEKVKEYNEIKGIQLVA